MLLLQELLVLLQLGTRACSSTYEGARFMCMLHCVCAYFAAAVSSSLSPAALLHKYLRHPSATRAVQEVDAIMILIIITTIMIMMMIMIYRCASRC